MSQSIDDSIYIQINIELHGVCVIDDSNNPILSGHYFSSPEMNVELCLSICRDLKFPFAGLQWQIECYCGFEPSSGFEWAWKDKCNDLAYSRDP